MKNQFGPPKEDNPNHVTRDELVAELKALHNRFIVYLALAVGLIRFDLPAPITAAVIVAAVAKLMAGILLRSA